VNLVFDFGGVLFRWEPHAFLARMLPHRTATAEATRALVADVFQGYGGEWGEFDRGTIEPEQLVARIALRTGITEPEMRRVIDGVPGELAPIDGTLALLQRLHAHGRPLYYLSNMPAPFALHLERTHAFLALFRRGLFSSRVQLVKPERAIFDHAAREFDVDPAQTLFIDDHEPNIVAARAAGWQALHFQSPAQCEAALVERGLL
jgi:putative hydrolase of the HAD superfamily